MKEKSFSQMARVTSHRDIVTSEMSPDLCLFFHQGSSICKCAHWRCSVDDTEDIGEQKVVKMSVVSS